MARKSHSHPQTALFSPGKTSRIVLSCSAVSILLHCELQIRPNILFSVFVCVNTRRTPPPKKERTPRLVFGGGSGESHKFDAFTCRINLNIPRDLPLFVGEQPALFRLRRLAWLCVLSRVGGFESSDWSC